tara:strand:- start:3507 stop:4526 length:1020 start_codon:yes stop_codon:yes gene_type:complete
MEQYLIKHLLELSQELSINIQKNFESGSKKSLIFMPVGIQGSGKTYLGKQLASNPKNNLVICGADKYMGTEFSFELLKESHRKCMIDIYNVILSGKNGYLDNTSGLSYFRTIYFLICKYLGAELVPFVIAQNYWLTPDSINEEFVNTITKRCLERYKLDGRLITKEIIMYTINSSRKDFNSIPNRKVSDWLEHFPDQSYKPGFSIIDNSCVFRHKFIDNTVDDYIKYPIVNGLEEEILKKKIRRGIENHITIIDSIEINEEIKTKINGIDFDDHPLPIPKGIGKIIEKEHYTLFIILEWKWAQELRKSLGLKEKDFHITLLWTGENNIYSGEKNINTLQ